MEHQEKYQEYLQSYIDGELPEIYHQVMFSELSINSSLQRELSEIIILRTISRRDIQMPPTTVEDALIAQLYAKDLTVPVPPLDIPRSTFIAALVGASFSAILTGIISWFVWANGSDTKIVVKEVTTPITKIPANGLAHQQYNDGSLSIAKKSKNTLPTVLSKLNPTHISGLKTLRDDERQLKSTPENNMSDAYTDAVQFSDLIELGSHQDMVSKMNSVDSLSISSIAIPKAERLTKSLSNETMYNVQTYSDANAQNSDIRHRYITEVSQHTNSKIMTELRFFTMRSYPNIDVPGLINPPVNNFGVCSMVILDKEHAVGIEAGQETVLQRYRKTVNGEIYEIDQNYLGWWVGGAYRYSPGWASISRVFPFVHVCIGGTSIGPIARSVLGIETKIFDPISLMVGVEGMGLISWEEKQLVMSSKLGITSGISVRF